MPNGGSYDPTSNNWKSLTTNAAPTRRQKHTAVWTGTEMLVWGGVSNTTYYANGGRYNPVDDTWTALPALGAPTARSVHTAVWTGSEMLVWGGMNSSPLSTGGRYNPVANSWTTCLPSVRLSRDLRTRRYGPAAKCSSGAEQLALAI